MASNVRQLPGKGAPAPVLDDDDDDDDECPKCPAVGAPAWLATFADIATNLMAFFVLILGFAKFDEPSFAKMAGSMRETFGSSLIAPISVNPADSNVIELDFNKGVDAEGTSDSPPVEDAPPGDPAEEGGQKEGSAAPPSTDEALAKAQAQAAGQALLQALASGELTIEQGDTSVKVRLPEGEDQPTPDRLAKALAEALDPKPTAEQPTSAPAAGEDGPAGGDGAEPAAGDSQLAEAQAGEGGAGGSQSGPGPSPGFAKAKLSVALEEEVANGLVTVERREGRVVVTVGEGGGFVPGSATLTPEARALMDRIVATAVTPEMKVTITGHTDNTPVRSGSPHVDNLGLGAARAAAVAREMMETGLVGPGQISAVSKGETAPIADNATEEGRAKNRRIEIEIDFPGTEVGDR